MLNKWYISKVGELNTVHHSNAQDKDKDNRTKTIS
jgi:hypothetical protein